MSPAPSAATEETPPTLDPVVYEWLRRHGTTIGLLDAALDHISLHEPTPADLEHCGELARELARSSADLFPEAAEGVEDVAAACAAMADAHRSGDLGALPALRSEFARAVAVSRPIFDAFDVLMYHGDANAAEETTAPDATGTSP